jgi:hypothetical protein
MSERGAVNQVRPAAVHRTQLRQRVADVHDGGIVGFSEGGAFQIVQLRTRGSAGAVRFVAIRPVSLLHHREGVSELVQRQRAEAIGLHQGICRASLQFSIGACLIQTRVSSQVERYLCVGRVWPFDVVREGFPHLVTDANSLIEAGWACAPANESDVGRRCPRARSANHLLEDELLIGEGVGGGVPTHGDVSLAP